MQYITVGLGVAILLAINPLLFMVCFNAVAPMFSDHAPVLEFWQAFAVVIAARIIFGGNPFGLDLKDV